MIKEKDLRDFRPDYKYDNAGALTLEFVQNKLEVAMANAGVAVAFEGGQIKTE